VPMGREGTRWIDGHGNEIRFICRTRLPPFCRL
jgi:hypothetical protein